MTTNNAYLSTLQDLIAACFNRDDLADLCLHLGVSFDSLPDAGLAAQARELILALARRERLPELLEELRVARPNGEWPDVPPDFRLPAPVAGAASPAGSKFAIGSVNAENVIIGDGGQQTINHFEMSGDFRGAILNIQSTLRDVRQSIEAMPAADDNVRAELIRLVGQLEKALQTAPPGREADAAEVAEVTKALVEAAGAEKPSKVTVRALGEGLMEAAAMLYKELPALVDIVTRIASAVSAIAGITG